MRSVTSPQPAISLQGVAKTYGRRPALHELDLDIAEGEFFCLLGPSGCGKTTTLNIIGGFVALRRHVHIRGAASTRCRRTGVTSNTVFQSYALFPHMTVAQNIGFGLRMAGVGAPRPSGASTTRSQLVGLEELERRLPASCPAASSSESPWRGRSSTGPPCCCSTSRSARST